MCGISGFVAHQDKLLSNSAVVRMNSLITHRGPDDEGYLFMKVNGEIVVAGGNSTPEDVWRTNTGYNPSIHSQLIEAERSILAFGHKRLSILDLSASGHQPMSYGNGRYWIVYNGEIYNHQELKAELISLGYAFRTKTDTEVVLAAYSNWGEACLTRFAGMWAFAIFDKEKEEIFLARDRYGMKPLYYHFSPDGNFYFASEIKQFTALVGWKSRLNHPRAYDQLVYSYTDHTDETMFAEVFQLPGGCSFRADLSKIRQCQDGRILFYRWYYVKQETFKASFSEAAENFRLLFERSVKEHLYADVPVGTALSGGLDSSSIVCEVNRILKSSGNESLQKTFSSCATDPRFNEKKWMDIVINYLNVDASYNYPQVKDVFEQTQNLIWYHDEPYQSQSALLAYQVFNMASNKGVKVLLNGQGADEYLGGYGQFTVPRYASMIRRFKICHLISDIIANGKRNDNSSTLILFQSISHLLPVILKRRAPNFFSNKNEAKRLINLKNLDFVPDHPHDIIPVNYRTVPDVSRHLMFHSTLPKYLKWEDRNSMANSVEARIPFLDHRLVEFSHSLPDDFLEKGGITKRVMREAMKDLLPWEIKDRKDKMGFATPEEVWVRQDAPDFFKEKISDAVDVSQGFIKPEALKYFDKIVSGTLPFDYTYWRIILFGEWIRKFRVKV